MQKLLAVAFPGFWLGLWQYGVLMVAWLILIRPARIFLHPVDIGPGGLGYAVLALLVGATSSIIFLVDSVLYASTLPGDFKRQAIVAVLITIGASIALTIIWGGGMLYGGNSTSTTFQRCVWIAVYGTTVCALLVAHLYAISRFRL